MKKYGLLAIFLILQIVSFGQKEFTLTNDTKSKLVSQSNFFTFYLRDTSNSITDHVYEGYVIDAVDKKYSINVFFEEYEKHDSDVSTDSLIQKRCSVMQECDLRLNMDNGDIVYFQTSNTGRIGLAKGFIALSAASFLTTTYLVLNPTTFSTRKSNNMVVAGFTGLTIGSLGVSIKLLNPKKHYTSNRFKKNGGWYIKE